MYMSSPQSFEDWNMRFAKTMKMPEWMPVMSKLRICIFLFLAAVRSSACSTPGVGMGGGLWVGVEK